MITDKSNQKKIKNILYDYLTLNFQIIVIL